MTIGLPMWCWLWLPGLATTVICVLQLGSCVSYARTVCDRTALWSTFVSSVILIECTPY